ncbi:MAG: hypothetical protein COW16_06670 [Sphingomonadales bacterium CG12_big_fil_rev_8_21_14_0_65_65_10]|nr:MAG: hypothetical protein COW16_06670 [Sphingomonadales bacterium CG12_big_fil_rev_8_21_14_0_65_65_10]
MRQLTQAIGNEEAAGPASRSRDRSWIRASDWWEYKLLPPLAVAYATSLYLDRTTYDALAAIALVLLSLLPGAIYVSVLNDLTDRVDDHLAGKPNPQIGRGKILPLAILAACATGGIFFGYVWRDNPFMVVVYATGWLAFSLYSLPPIRLKTRGAAGVFCDAIGANAVPAVLAALACIATAQVADHTAWLAAVAIWSTCFGLRGILWHQIVDVEFDRRAGANTLVARIGVEAAARWARRVIFPLELIAIGSLALLGGPVVLAAGVVAMALYGWLVWERNDRFLMVVRIVGHHPRGTLFLHEFYDVFLPIALLVTCIAIDPRNLAVLALHLLLFPKRWRQVLDDVTRLRDPQYESSRGRR